MNYIRSAVLGASLSFTVTSLKLQTFDPYMCVSGEVYSSKEPPKYEEDLCFLSILFELIFVPTNHV